MNIEYTVSVTSRAAATGRYCSAREYTFMAARDASDDCLRYRAFSALGIAPIGPFASTVGGVEFEFHAAQGLTDVVAVHASARKRPHADFIRALRHTTTRRAG